MEYNGCNIVLYEDILTKRFYNKAYIAHIIADSADGPRGHKTKSKYLNDDISNLMLLCDAHHRLIDKEDIDGHTVENLINMKENHESRIRLTTGLQPELRSEVIRFGANTGKHFRIASYPEAAGALLPDYYPNSKPGIQIGFKRSEIKDIDEIYWST